MRTQNFSGAHSQMANSHSHKLQRGKFWLDIRKKLFSVKMSKFWKKRPERLSTLSCRGFSISKSIEQLHLASYTALLWAGGWRSEESSAIYLYGLKRQHKLLQICAPCCQALFAGLLWNESTVMSWQSTSCIDGVHFHTALQTGLPWARLPLTTLNSAPGPTKRCKNCVLQGLDFTSIRNTCSNFVCYCHERHRQAS